MATTSNGLPYPVGTDKVVDGDDAIKALADALNLRTPQPKVIMGGGGYTTNSYGGIIVTAAGFTVAGLVAVAGSEGYACTKPQGVPPVGQFWINVFSTSNGSLAANAFIIVYYIAFGS